MADPLDILTGTVRRESGDGFNNTLANLAQVLQSIPEMKRRREAQQDEAEYRRARILTQQQELGLKQQEFGAKQRAAEMGAAANAIVQGAMVQKEDGSWVVDRSRVQKGFGASQVPPEMQLKTLKALDDIDESLSKFATVKREHTAGVLNGVIKAIDDGIDPDMALTTGIAVGKKNGLISDDDLQGLEGLLSGGDVRKNLSQMRDTLSDKYADKEETLAPGAMRVRGGHVIAQNTKSATPTEASIALEAAGGDPNKAMEMLKAKNPTEASIAMQAAGGDPAKALRLMQTMRPPPMPVVIQTSEGPQLLNRGTATTTPIKTAGGSTVQAKTSATMESRLASAQAAIQTGDDIIAQLKDPSVASKLGPAMGRFNSLRDFLGNPPPELAELAGSIESYARINMGIHGMRSEQGARDISEKMGKKYTPEALAGFVQGMNKMSSHLMENAGRPVPGGKHAGESLSVAQVDAIAKKMGVNYADAKKQAESQGYTVKQ